MDSVTLGLPLLSIYDPDGTGGTSIDPLGLTPLGEQLSVELIPGVRERQSHPRYLTAIAVSHAICDEFPADTVAADGVSEPWQVFEWYLVEGLVRSAASAPEANVPGSQKAEKAFRQGLPLSASRYLKTPTIFGFHGVYRLLARTLSVEQADRLADFGFELLDVWQKERGLNGFYGSGVGYGRNIRSILTEAVRKGLNLGETTGSDGWSGWRFFFDHLDPTKAGPKESQLIWRKLESGTKGFRKEVLGFVVSKNGQNLFRTEGVTEKKLYSALKRIASTELRTRIETIQRYENFCRLLLDAFEACRHDITQTRRGVQPSRLGTISAVAKAAELLPEAFITAEADFGQSTRGAQFRRTFLEVSQKRTATDFVMALFEHHKRVQKAKPPEGKTSWLEQHFDGSLLVRPEFRLDKAPRAIGEFVNPYRLKSLNSFAVDLKQV